MIDQDADQIDDTGSSMTTETRSEEASGNGQDDPQIIATGAIPRFVPLAPAPSAKVGPLLGLEPPSTENPQQNLLSNEDSNPSSRSAPLLGTIFPFAGEAAKPREFSDLPRILIRRDPARPAQGAVVEDGARVARRYRSKSIGHGSRGLASAAAGRACRRLSNRIEKA